MRGRRRAARDPATPAAPNMRLRLLPRLRALEEARPVGQVDGPQAAQVALHQRQPTVGLRRAACAHPAQPQTAFLARCWLMVPNSTS